MDQLSGARIVSSSPGRLRLQIPGLYHSSAAKRRLEARLARHAAVVEVLASTLTGRVLLRFGADLAPAALLAELGIATVPAPAAPAAGVAPAAAVSPSGRDRLYPPWHLRDASEAVVAHGSSAERGLSQYEAEQRLKQGGNLVALPRGRSAAEILLGQFRSTPVVLLGISAVAALLTGGLAEAAAIGAVLVMNTSIGYATERQAEASISSLSELVDDQVLALRGGAVARVDASRLVPGDVVVLAPGSRIAADLRLLRAAGLRMDESLLTGESAPVEKHAGVLAAAAPLAERRNMAYRGTAVASGTGLGLVVGTGSRTEAGVVEALTGSTERPLTPIQLQLDQLGSQLVRLSIALCLGVAGVGLLWRHPRGPLLRAVVALAIAAVPEGLPAVATTALARGLRRLRARGMLFRHLHAVETIGAISTICLDKTGTLTMNRMTAVQVRTAGQALSPQGIGPAALAGAGELAHLLEVCVLSSESHAQPGWRESPLQASSTELALLALARRGGVDAAALRQRYPLLAGELRAARRNYMRTVHATPRRGQVLVAVKGSPAEVLALCSHYLQDGHAHPCDGASCARILDQNDEMAGAGLRVLGFACAQVPAHRPDKAALSWLGLVGLADPLRPGVEQVIRRFHEAGIRTVMLTGDQAGTALQIGRALRLGAGAEPNVVHAEELEHMPPERLRELAAHADIFSRVTPSDKLRIVQALRAAGATVAMTGDGINDSPALRAADVGIAMGSGAAVALSVADVALKDDRLDYLLDAVAQGRALSDSIRKSVHFLVSSNLSEILVVFGAVAAGRGSPLKPLQILWLNLLTDILPAIALAEEPAERGLMRRPPRDPRAALVGGADMLRYAREASLLAAGALGAYGLAASVDGDRKRAGTVGFDAMVLGQCVHALFCRSERQPAFACEGPRNPHLARAVAASAGLQLLVHLVPGLRRALGLATPGPLGLAAIAAGAFLPLLANDAAKARDQSRAATRDSAARSTNFSTIAAPIRAPLPGAVWPG